MKNNIPVDDLMLICAKRMLAKLDPGNNRITATFDIRGKLKKKNYVATFKVEEVLPPKQDD